MVSESPAKNGFGGIWSLQRGGGKENMVLRWFQRKNEDLTGRERKKRNGMEGVMSWVWRRGRNKGGRNESPAILLSGHKEEKRNIDPSTVDQRGEKNPPDWKYNPSGPKREKKAAMSASVCTAREGKEPKKEQYHLEKAKKSEGGTRRKSSPKRNSGSRRKGKNKPGKSVRPPGREEYEVQREKVFLEKSDGKKRGRCDK